jgi:hypothetical protein
MPEKQDRSIGSVGSPDIMPEVLGYEMFSHLARVTYIKLEA